MWKRIALVTVLAAGLVLPSIGAAKDKKDKDVPWVHIEVRESGGDQAKVNVNLPLSIMDVAMDMLDDELDLDGDVEIADGKIHINDSDVSVADLRKIWRELRDAGDADFVTVQEDEETVNIRRKGDLVLIDIEDSGRHHSERVSVKIPVRIVDALLQGEGEELDLRGAVAELRNMPAGDIVTVEGGEDLVRIWID